MKRSRTGEIQEARTSNGYEERALEFSDLGVGSGCWAGFARDSEVYDSAASSSWRERESREDREGRRDSDVRKCGRDER